MAVEGVEDFGSLRLHLQEPSDGRTTSRAPRMGRRMRKVRTAPIPQVMGAAVEEWVRTGEVARSLGVSRWTVRRLILSGVLPARRFAERGTFLVDRVDLEMFLERSRVHAEAG